MRLTDLQFKKLFPGCPAAKRQAYLPLLVAAMIEFGVTTRKRAAAFCAQLAHESCDLKYMEEIASGAAYEGRRDLGNTQRGDGRRFKGRGPIQTTGRTNYRRAGEALGLPLLEQPELLSDPRHGFRASAFFWQSNNLNRLADALRGTGDARDLKLFDRITKRVNGGYNGRVDRQANYLTALEVLTDEQFEESSAQPTPSEPHTAPQPAAPTAPQPQATGGEQDKTETEDDILETVSSAASAKPETAAKVGGGLWRGLLWVFGSYSALSAGAKVLVLFGVVTAIYFIYRHRSAIKSRTAGLVARANRALKKFTGAA